MLNALDKAVILWYDICKKSERGKNMDKIEKAIKGLECCIFSPGFCPDDCTYKGKGDENGYCDDKLIKDALALLKAQEAVRPVTGLWDRDIQLYKCGACGGEIGAGGIAKYCFHCGRKVKWDG